jgi:hypothetical protein
LPLKTLEFYVKMDKISERFMPVPGAGDVPKRIRDRFGYSFMEIEGKEDLRRYARIMGFTGHLSKFLWEVGPEWRGWE